MKPSVSAELDSTHAALVQSLVRGCYHVHTRRGLGSVGSSQCFCWLASAGLKTRVVKQCICMRLVESAQMLAGDDAHCYAGGW
jgi:hypothetical protein